VTEPRTIAVLTTGRQDWGILHSTCVALRAGPDIDLRLLVGGMHLSPRFGRTIDTVRADGFEPAAELAWIDDADGDHTAADATGGEAADEASRALAAVAAALEAIEPDALLLVGDRFETAAAALAATILRIPIAHLHGGEQTGGAFDDQLRHATTKLSHLHLVSHPEYARRVAALGEDPATISVVGAPGLDSAFRDDLADRGELADDLGLDLDEGPLVLVTIQPVTLEADPAAVAEPILAAIDQVPAAYVFTLPNADPGAERIRDRVLAAAVGDRRVAVEALGERRYWGLMRIADAMLGNSSSGIIEAPAVDLPVVNVGDRQAGRRREANVIDVPAEASSIADALRTSLDPATRARIVAAHPDLADGHAGRRIADIIAAWRPPIPPRKAPIEVGP
jgi:UDP-hydrolysing UDP-N-acetyl-D-glucosamine 2-epimerase